MDHLLLSLHFQRKLSWWSKKLRTFFHFAFKKKLTSCTLRDTEREREREREHPRKKIIHQTKLDPSTQNPKERNVLQKTKSCTRLNWTTALKIPEQRGNAWQITNLNNEVPSEHQNHICLLHIWSIPKKWLLTQNHTGSWYTYSFVPFAGCLIEVLHVFGCTCTESWNIFLSSSIIGPSVNQVTASPPLLVKSLNSYNTGLKNWKNKVSWWLWQMWACFITSSYYQFCDWTLKCLGGHLGPHKTDYKAHDAWNLVVQPFFSGLILLTGLWHTWPFPALFFPSLLLPMLQIQASTPNLHSSKTTGWKIAFRLLRQTPVQLILANRLGERTTNRHLKVNTVFFPP